MFFCFLFSSSPFLPLQPFLVFPASLLLLFFSPSPWRGPAWRLQWWRPAEDQSEYFPQSAHAARTRLCRTRWCLRDTLVLAFVSWRRNVLDGNYCEPDPIGRFCVVAVPTVTDTVAYFSLWMMLQTGTWTTGAWTEQKSPRLRQPSLLLV